MNKFSNRLTDCRSRLLDAEAILHHLHKPENLNHLLEECSPEVTLGAMIDKAWSLVSEASGDCEAMCDTHNDQLKAEIQNTAAEFVSHQREQASPRVAESTPSHAARTESMEQIDEIHTQTDSLLSMLLLYLDQARDGGETFNEHVLSSYVWQLQSNVRRAQEISDKLFRSIR